MVTSRRAFFALAAGAVVAGAGGCSGRPKLKPLDATLVNVMPRGGGLLSQTLALTLRLTNPNDTDVPLDGIRAKLALNGNPFADGVSNTEITVPALGTREVTVEATAGTLNVLRQVLETGSRKTLSYELTGTAHPADALTDRGMAFSDSGEISLSPGGTPTMKPLDA